MFKLNVTCPLCIELTQVDDGIYSFGAPATAIESLRDLQHKARQDSCVEWGETLELAS